MASLCIWLLKHFGYWKTAKAPAVIALADTDCTGFQL